MPRIRVLAGGSPDAMRVIAANDGTAYPVESDAFEGCVAVFIKYDDALPDNCGPAADYFGASGREGVSWSIQVQGRFLQPRRAATVLFGNMFDRELRLPVGTSAVLKFMRLIDPQLEHDLAGERPWALSPFFCTVPHIRVQRSPDGPRESSPGFPPHPPLQDGDDDCTALGAPAGTGRYARRDWFAANDSAVVGPSDLITADFCHGRLRFPSVSLEIPGPGMGLSFSLAKHWPEGMRVYFVCRERPDDESTSESKDPSHIFWCVAFELED